MESAPEAVVEVAMVAPLTAVEVTPLRAVEAVPIVAPLGAAESTLPIVEPLQAVVATSDTTGSAPVAQQEEPGDAVMVAHAMEAAPEVGHQGSHGAL
jgi:hypothetical protein